jgi:hypothetical protein
MSSYRKLTGFVAAAALAFAIGAGTAAHAALTINTLTVNALTSNALAAQGSAIADLNGVAIDGGTPADRAARPADERGQQR